MVKAREDFKSSRDLRLFFNEQFEAWKDRTSGTLKDLAAKCGVSPSYLSQISRYGRIPGRPVMILLAFNFRIADPQRFFELCAVQEDWPYERKLGLFPDTRAEDSFVSLRVDMPGLTSAIRSVLRQEMRQSSSRDLLGAGPIIVGLNPMQPWMHAPGGIQSDGGFFREFMSQLGLSLQRQVSFKVVPFAAYRSKLESGEIDLYGPVMSPPTSPQGIVYTGGLLRTAVVGVLRCRDSEELPKLAIPKKFDELKKSGYKVAVLRGALPHMVVNSRLKIPDNELVLCDSDEEARDRIILKGIQNPAHIFFCNSLMAESIVKTHSKDVKLVFADDSSVLDYEEVGIAIKPDWKPIEGLFKQSLDFLLKKGGQRGQLEEAIGEKSSRLLSFAL